MEKKDKKKQLPGVSPLADFLPTIKPLTTAFAHPSFPCLFLPLSF